METAHTQREDTNQQRERNTEESTYNRKQRNFTCSVVLMHQGQGERQTDGEKKSV